MVNGVQTATWVRVLGWLAIFAVTLLLIGRIYQTLLLFGISAALAYVMHSWVRWVHSGRLGRPVSWTQSVILVYMTIPLLMAIVLLIAAPVISEQVDTISNNLPQQATRFQQSANYWQVRFDRAKLPKAVRQRAQTFIDQNANRLGDGVTYVVTGTVNFLVSTFSWVLFLLMALIISMFMLLHLPQSREAFWEAVPEAYRQDVDGLIVEINEIFGGFVKGTAILSCVSGGIIFVLLSALSIVAWLGVPGFVPSQYSLLIGLLAVVTYPIPIAGMVLLSIVAGVLAYLENGSAAYVLTVMAITVSVALGVDRFISPRLMSNAMGVSPLFVMFSVFAGAELLGFWGMLLGVPVAAAIKVLFRYVRRRFLVVPITAEEMRVDIVATPPRESPAAAPAQEIAQASGV
ncbi:MAG: AI-2E family transporter [Armatimonadetes bacterium]|nr:AI-2E family transporter [Armatimonadota bacterium]